MVNLKNTNSFKKDSPKKLVSRRNYATCHTCIVGRGNIGKVYVKNLFGIRNHLKIRSIAEKKHIRSTTLDGCLPALFKQRILVCIRIEWIQVLASS
jgi:hypothetical protein